MSGRVRDTIQRSLSSPVLYPLLKNRFSFYFYYYCYYTLKKGQIEAAWNEGERSHLLRRRRRNIRRISIRRAATGLAASLLLQQQQEKVVTHHLTTPSSFYCPSSSSQNMNAAVQKRPAFPRQSLQNSQRQRRTEAFIYLPAFAPVAK